MKEIPESVAVGKVPESLRVKMIAAVGRNNELGIDGGLIWHLPGDLKFFKETTMGKAILMGRKTWESLPGMLPGRKHYVLTHKSQKSLSTPEVFVIGGGSVYRQMLPLAEEIYLTEIEAEEPRADTYFPEFDKTQYERKILGKGEDDGIKYTFVLYRKK